MEQLGLAGMPARLLRCTPSRLTTWLDCPRRYRLTYLDRPAPPKGPPWAHNTVGAAVHLALARWWSLPLSRRSPPGARTLLDRGWKDDGFAGAEQSRLWRDRAADHVERYAATLDPYDEPVGVERTVAMRTAGLAVSGRVDRIDARDGELVIVDYKTGRHVPDTADARGSLALALYAAAAARTLRRPCSRIELHHLPTGRVAAHEHTAGSLARQVQRAEDLGAEIVGATDAAAAGGDPVALFPARTGPACGWCDHMRSCPAGLAVAGVPRRPWDGLPAPDTEGVTTGRTGTTAR